MYKEAYFILRNKTVQNLMQFPSITPLSTEGRASFKSPIPLNTEIWPVHDLSIRNPHRWEPV